MDDGVSDDLSEGTWIADEYEIDSDTDINDSDDEEDYEEELSEE